MKQSSQCYLRDVGSQTEYYALHPCPPDQRPPKKLLRVCLRREDPEAQALQFLAVERFLLTASTQIGVYSRYRRRSGYKMGEDVS